jgi:hypothetical protein
VTCKPEVNCCNQAFTFTIRVLSVNAVSVSYRFLDGWLFAKLLLFIPAKSPEYMELYNADIYERWLL